METVEIEREKLDQLIRSALVAENEGLQPPDHVWQRILRRADHLDNRPVFGTEDMIASLSTNQRKLPVGATHASPLPTAAIFEVAARAEQSQVLVTSIS